MKEFFDKIYDFLLKNKDAHLRLPPNVNTILQERDSRWSFILEIGNSTSSEKEIALLTGIADSSRFQVINASSQFTALGGGLVTTPYSSGAIINLKDDPRLINKIAGSSCDCVVSQEHHNASVDQAIPEQTIYKDGTGEVTVSSKDFYWNFFKEFLKISPLRVFELQIASDNINVFSQQIQIKELNPLQRENPELINLEDYYLPSSTNELKIIVPSPFNLTAETFMSIIVPADTSLTLGFRVSAYHSEANALKNKLQTGVFLSNLKTALEKEEIASTTRQRLLPPVKTNTELAI